MNDAPQTDSEPTPVTELSFEAASQELEAIIDRLERGDVPLETSLDAYGRGQALLGRCRSILDRAATRIEEVDLEASPDEGDHGGAGSSTSGDVPF